MREPLQISEDAIRIGILTFVAVVRGNNNHFTGALFRCDCGRMVKIPERVVRSIRNGKLADLPWACEACDYKIPDKAEKVKYRPWNPRVLVKHERTAHERRLAEIHIPSCDKTMHPAEWFAWQQAKRISKGVVARWQEFANFYKDMGDRPDGARLSKRDSKRRHGPGNSFWQRTTSLVWNETRVSDKWVMEEFNIPRHYIVMCKKAGWFDVRFILVRYRQGYPPPKKGDKHPTQLIPQFID